MDKDLGRWALNSALEYPARHFAKGSTWPLVSPTPQVTRFCSSITCPELEAEKVFPSVKSEHQTASLVAFPGFRASAYKISLILVSHTRQMGPFRDTMNVR